jgi:WD40 repeat protein
MSLCCPALFRTSAFTLITLAAGWGSISGAQATSNVTRSPDPVGYAYVTEENASNTGAQTEGYAIGSDGSLSALAGSPYNAATVGDNAVSGNYLFLSDDLNGSVVTYSIASGGALTQVTTTNVGAYPLGTASEGPFTLSFDTTGKSVYPLWAENDVYQAFNVDEKNGSLNYVDYATAAGESSSGLAFTGNDKYAYESGCYHGTPTIEGYTRASNGGLTLTWNPELPPQPSGAQYSYCPGGAATSGDDYVVIAEQQNDEMAAVGPFQMVVFKVDPSNGSLTTSNTADTAVQTSIGAANSYVFDPTGNWLAVGGPSGVEVFSFSNGKLKETGTYFITSGVSQVAWDHDGHLVVYAVGSGAQGLLYVFNVAKGVPTVASGSPVTTEQAYGSLAVKPLS